MINQYVDLSPVDSYENVLRTVLNRFSENVILRDDLGASVRYGDVAELAYTKAFRETKRRLVICEVNNDCSGIAGYLALVAAEAVPMMVSSALTQSAVDTLISAYKPEYLWLPQEQATRWPRSNWQACLGGYALIGLTNGTAEAELHVSLALLLSTSGSTGSSKYVRLSHQNVWTNAAAIADYLSLTSDELPITTLPPSYSYGLSIIHSHLLVGAGIAVCNKTFFDREFWNFFREVKATSLSGVPYHYEILKKLRFTTMSLPHLRTLTQAGGRMNPDLAKEFAIYAKNNGMRFFMMYGQTEASPRISYVPSERAYEKAGTVGVPIPGGKLELLSDSGVRATETESYGELVYRGPNVCLGYAECRADLSAGDVNQGVLQTGDFAERDAEGYYKIVGRRNRFIKLFGNRISLEDIESLVAGIQVDSACSGRDDALELYLTPRNATRAIEVKQVVMASFNFGAQSISVYEVDDLPRNEYGKVQYATLSPAIARRLA